MRINSVNNNSFKGLIKFNNKSINPKYVLSITPKKDNDMFEKTFVFEMANGKKYFYTESKPNGVVQEFTDIVSKNMYNNKTYTIDADLKEITKLKGNKNEN